MKKRYISEKCSKIRVLRFLKSGPSVNSRFVFLGDFGSTFGKYGAEKKSLHQTISGYLYTSQIEIMIYISCMQNKVEGT